MLFFILSGHTVCDKHTMIVGLSKNNGAYSYVKVNETMRSIIKCILLTDLIKLIGNTGIIGKLITKVVSESTK